MQKTSLYKIFIAIIMFWLSAKINAQTIDSVSIDAKVKAVYTTSNDSAYSFKVLYEAINESQKIGYKNGEVAAMQLLGYLYIEYGKMDSAKFYLFKSHELAKLISNQGTIAQNYRLLAIYYESNDKFDEALDLLFKSVLIRKKMNDLKGEYGTYISIGVIYQRLFQNSKAIEYYKKAASYFESIDNESAATSVYSNLAAVYNRMGQIDSAIYLLKKVIVHKTKMGDKLSLAKAYHNIAVSYSHIGQYSVAENYFFKSLAAAGGGVNNFQNANDYSMLGELYTKMNKLAEAEKYFLICEKMQKNINDLEGIADTYDNLRMLYEQKKDFKKAIFYRSSHTRIKDSLDYAKGKSLISEIETKYKTQEKEQENLILKAENKLLESETKYNNYMAFGLFLLLVVSLILSYNLKVIRVSKNKLQHHNEVIASQSRELTNQNHNLEHLIEENHVLMGVLAHDLRSPFAKIAGLANILEDETDPAEQKAYIDLISGICKESLQLIQDTIQVSELFYNKNVEANSKMESFYPAELLVNILKGFKAVANEKSIDIEVVNTIENLSIYNSKEFLNRVLDNLLSNAIKFSPRNSKIVFSATQTAQHLVFSVKDNGPGFSDKDKEQLFMRFKKLSARPTANEASSGLGLFIVKQLTTLMHGDIQVISEFGKGSEFVLTIPLQISAEA
jgi:signal transduction histidine kinase